MKRKNIIIGKNVVAGLGEIGMPILKLLDKNFLTIGYDINPKLMDMNQFKKYQSLDVSFLHICIPFTKNFVKSIINLNSRFKPKCIIIHSTISPGTTSTIQSKLKTPVIYSATRGVHKRMLTDLKRYTKFYSIESNAPRAKWASSLFSKLMKKCGIKTKKMSSPITLELAKI